MIRGAVAYIERCMLEQTEGLKAFIWTAVCSDVLHFMHWEIQVYCIFEFYNIKKSGKIGHHLQLLLLVMSDYWTDCSFEQATGWDNSQNQTVGGSYTIFNQRTGLK